LYTSDAKALISEIVTLSIASLVILFTNEKRSDFYYYLLVDGLLIVQSMVAILTNYK